MTVDVDAIRAALGGWTHDCQRVIASLCDEIAELRKEMIERLEAERDSCRNALAADLVAFDVLVAERDAAIAECERLHKLKGRP